MTEKTYFGMKWRIATPFEMLQGLTGKLVYRTKGWAFFQKDNNVYILESDAISPSSPSPISPQGKDPKGDS